MCLVAKAEAVLAVGLQQEVEEGRQEKDQGKPGKPVWQDRLRVVRRQAHFRPKPTRPGQKDPGVCLPALRALDVPAAPKLPGPGRCGPTGR